MKKILSVFLTIILLQSFLIFLPARIAAQTEEKLTNESVIDLVKSGFSDEIISAKIASSANDFDTSINALQELKNNKVSDALIVLMVGGGSPTVVVKKPRREIEMTIPDGTVIDVVLRNDLSGQYAKKGDIVHFTVVSDVKIDGVTVIERDASATAKVTKAEKARYWGRKGKIEWEMQDVTTAGGEKIPVTFTKTLNGDSNGGTVAAATVGTALLLFPIAPVALFWGLKKGEPAAIASGNYYSVFVSGTSKIKVKI